VLIVSLLSDRGLERREGGLPEPVEVRAELAQPVGVEPVDAARADLPLGHEPGLLQYPQVLRDGRPADGELTCELADGAGARLQELEDPPASRIAERIHRTCVSHHLR
jgi:hypothetical protein